MSVPGNTVTMTVADPILSLDQFDKNLNDCYLAGYAAGRGEKPGRDLDEIREEMFVHDAALRLRAEGEKKT